MSFTMLTSKTVIVKCIHKDYYTDLYQISKQVEKSNRKVYQSLLILLLRYAVQLNIDKFLLVFYITGLLGGHTGHGIVITSMERKYWQVQS
jgi:hypothetical protein